MQSLHPSNPLGNPEDLPLSRLLPVTPARIGQQEINAADGRRLHAFMEVGKVFAAWMPEQIEAFGFVEHQDYEVVEGLSFPNSESAKARPQKTKEYLLSIPMAKELAMVQRTAKGKQARLYFIECERRAQNPVAFLNDPTALRGVLLTYTEKVLALEAKVGVLAPKAEALERIAKHGEGAMCPTNAAKVLQIERNKLFGWLQANGWIYRRHGNKNWLGYHDKVKAGYLEHKVHPYIDADGGERMNEQLLVTAKGLAKLAQAFGVVLMDGGAA